MSDYLEEKNRVTGFGGKVEFRGERLRSPAEKDPYVELSGTVESTLVIALDHHSFSQGNTGGSGRSKGCITIKASSFPDLFPNLAPGTEVTVTIKVAEPFKGLLG